MPETTAERAHVLPRFGRTWRCKGRSECEWGPGVFLLRAGAFVWRNAASSKAALLRQLALLVSPTFLGWVRDDCVVMAVWLGAHVEALDTMGFCFFTLFSAPGFSSCKFSGFPLVPRFPPPLVTGTSLHPSWKLRCIP
jgi:hypothetical protein